MANLSLNFPAKFIATLFGLTTSPSASVMFSVSLKGVERSSLCSSLKWNVSSWDVALPARAKMFWMLMGVAVGMGTGELVGDGSGVGGDVWEHPRVRNRASEIVERSGRIALDKRAMGCSRLALATVVL